MDSGSVTSGLKGMANALDAQKLGAELITRTLNQGDLSKSALQVTPSAKTTQLAKAVTGLGAKIDITV